MIVADDDFTEIRRPELNLEKTDQRSCLIVLSGQQIGRMYKLTKPKIVIGRSDDADVQLEDEGISRHHVRLIAMPGGVVMLNDLESKNGTFVNGQQVRSRALEDGDRIQLGAITILKFSIHDSLEERFQEQLYASATRDPLTGAYNNRYFGEHLDKEVTHAERHGTPLSLVLLDLDHFKHINDSHGHLAGDHVLRELVACMSGAIRSDDVLARLGGEEFGLIMRGSTLEGACSLAERLRHMIESHAFEHAGQRIEVTVSAGVSSYAKGHHGSRNAFVADADRQLYEAKRAGRNCIRSSPLK
jgi:two-component system cell cycle response regulator